MTSEPASHDPASVERAARAFVEAFNAAYPNVRNDALGWDLVNKRDNLCAALSAPPAPGVEGACPGCGSENRDDRFCHVKHRVGTHAGKHWPTHFKCDPCAHPWHARPAPVEPAKSMPKSVSRRLAWEKENPAPVELRPRETCWFIENTAGLWLHKSGEEHTRDPNAAMRFDTKVAADAEIHRIANLDGNPRPYETTRFYRATEHVFFGDAEVEAARATAPVEKDLEPSPSMMGIPASAMAGTPDTASQERPMLADIAKRHGLTTPRAEAGGVAVAWAVMPADDGKYRVFATEAEARTDLLILNATDWVARPGARPFRVVPLARAGELAKEQREEVLNAVRVFGAARYQEAEARVDPEATEDERKSRVRACVVAYENVVRALTSTTTTRKE